MARQNKNGSSKRWGREGQDGFHSPSRRIIHPQRLDHRQDSGLEESFAQGPGSGMRMLTYFINRAGRGLSPERRAELEQAKSLLARRVERECTYKRSKTA